MMNEKIALHEVTKDRKLVFPGFVHLLEAQELRVRANSMGSGYQLLFQRKVVSSQL